MGSFFDTITSNSLKRNIPKKLHNFYSQAELDSVNFLVASSFRLIEKSAGRKPNETIAIAIAYIGVNIPKMRQK